MTSSQPKTLKAAARAFTPAAISATSTTPATKRKQAALWFNPAVRFFYVQILHSWRSVAAHAYLIAGSKLRSHAEGGAQFAARRNCLDSFFFFKHVLFVVIG